MSRLRALRIFLWALVPIAGLAGWLGAGRSVRDDAAVEVTSPIAAIGGPFRLTTHKGESFSDANLRGRPFLVFFGFTHCPEICPTTLADLTGTFEALGADAEKLTALMISVDPERDTADLLASYMTAFDSRIIALRGSAAETEAAARAYKAYFKKVPLGGDSYTMDHTTTIYMMDRAGRFVGTLDRHEGEQIKLAKIRNLMQR